MHERYGKRNSVYVRFRRWAEQGVRSAQSQSRQGDYFCRPPSVSAHAAERVVELDISGDASAALIANGASHLIQGVALKNGRNF